MRLKYKQGKQKMTETDIENSIRIFVLERLFGVSEDDIPPYVHKVSVRNVFYDKWRVNVFLKGTDKNPIPYSYLIEFSIEEGIVSSIPDIVRNIKTEFDVPKLNAQRLF